jgi:hypothetical protein
MARELGVRGVIRFVRETLSGPWLDFFWVQKRLMQLHLKLSRRAKLGVSCRVKVPVGRRSAMIFCKG